MLRFWIWIGVPILFYVLRGHSQQSENNFGFRRDVRSFAPNKKLLRTLVPPDYESYSPLKYKDPVAVSQRRKLAEVMKRRYKTFRRKLEKTVNDEIEAYKKKRNFSYKIKSSSAWSANPPIISGMSQIKGTSYSKNYLDSNTIKQLRSAGEAPGKLRLGSLPPEALPVLPHQHLRYESLKLSSLSENTDSGETAGKTLLDRRLGPSAPAKYDPSIVVDFNLLKLTHAPNRRPYKQKQESIFPGKTIILTSKRPSYGQITERDIGHRHTPANSVYVRKDVGKREEMSVYISTSVLPKMNPIETSNKTLQDGGEYGPHSRGNDSKAGVSPSAINIPEMPIEQLNLPQSVRDSLRKYLQPLLVALKPLTKSVPGLPGLDYPILSVVPYTNFYCSNMPWPGFYADTEARCQTWHACDVDGRQSTFLCPNGTVFNQALMVCDWWYNSDCLTAPFLYSLNERLFGYIKEPLVLPYRRITPELLDSIFL